MKILRNGKLTDPAETPDTLVGFVSDIYEQFVEAATTPMRPYIGNKALRTMAFDLALTDYDRELMRLMGVKP